MTQSIHLIHAFLSHDCVNTRCLNIFVKERKHFFDCIFCCIITFVLHGFILNTEIHGVSNVPIMVSQISLHLPSITGTHLLEQGSWQMKGHENKIARSPLNVFQDKAHSWLSSAELLATLLFGLAPPLRGRKINTSGH